MIFDKVSERKNNPKGIIHQLYVGVVLKSIDIPFFMVLFCFSKIDPLILKSWLGIVNLIQGYRIQIFHIHIFLKNRALKKVQSTI